VLEGEQSNTSIIYEAPDGDIPPVICKLFRTIHHGENPDVELQSALALAGSTSVPRSIGSVRGEWSDTGQPTGRAAGHLAFAQEFLPGVEDAWRVALRSAEQGIDFTVAAHDLGVATAHVHATLALALPSTPTTPADIAAVLGQMHARLDAAINEVPELEERRHAIEEVFEVARSLPWPARQRIHGDYHLGQVLTAPGLGWILVDFEGEPLRPMVERTQLDVPLRDVAGMLRSFHYVAGCLTLEKSLDTIDWALAAREAFLDGYVEASGYDVRTNRALLDAFEIDKALYETVYEARNRPAWVQIPVRAIARLTGQAVTP
jgi:predicted trehalose synthase